MQAGKPLVIVRSVRAREYGPAYSPSGFLLSDIPQYAFNYEAVLQLLLRLSCGRQSLQHTARRGMTVIHGVGNGDTSTEQVVRHRPCSRGDFARPDRKRSRRRNTGFECRDGGQHTVDLTDEFLQRACGLLLDGIHMHCIFILYLLRDGKEEA